MNCLLEYSKKLIAIHIIIFAATSYAQTGSVFDTDIQVVKSDNSGITIKYSVPNPEFQNFKLENKDYKSLEISRAGQVRVEGQVQIPVKIIPIGLPPGATANISVINSEYMDYPYIKLAPFFARGTQDEYNAAYSSVKAENPDIPSSIPYILSTENIRGLNVARIAVPTAKYSMSKRTLSVMKSITLRINFTNSGRILESGNGNSGKIYNRIFKNIIANYSEAQSWFQPRSARPTVGASVASSPFDSASTWIRIELATEGIYKIGWLEFSSIGIDPLSIDPDQIRIFHGGGRELPVDNATARPTLTEIPIDVLDGDDGQFDNGDLIVFYANSVDGWQYSSYHNRYQHYRNHYTDKNIYWLAIDGNFSSSPNRFNEIDGSPGGSFDISVDNFKFRYQKEVDWIFWRTYPTSFIRDYFDWYWGFGKTFETSVQLTDLISGGETMAYVRHRSGLPTLMVNGGEPINSTAFNDSSSFRYSSFNSGNFTSGLNQIKIEAPSDFYFDNIEIHYPRWLKAVDGNLRFSQPDTSGVIRYNMSDVSGSFILLEITDPLAPAAIINAEINGTNIIFNNYADSGSHTEFYISTLSRLKSPGNVSIYEPDNLRDVSAPDNQADIILVTYDGFAVQAARLADLRHDQYGLSTRVVKISDIYNQFSWGLADPLAIRDFLKFTYENWPEPAPAIVTLLGDGHYDYRKNLGGANQIFIPPYENSTVMSDEHFIYFGPFGYLDSDTSLVPDMMIGRIPAKSEQDAEEMIDKFVNYDGNPDLMPWRNKIVIVADDNLHPPNGITETYHTAQAENLANNHVPGRFEVAKIYLVEYPLRTGGEKPEAREALIGAFNSGALIVDWIGHGSPGLWADEHIFRRSQDIARLTNARRLPLIYTASCSIGFFDDPSTESFAEELLRTNIRGGVAVISATREVYAGANAQLNAKVYDLLLGSDSIGMGEALYTAKYLRNVQTSENDRSYIILGDPAQILQFPKFDVQFSTSPDSIVALSVGSVAGDIIDNSGNLMSEFNGTAWVTVKDGTLDRTVVLRDRNNNPINRSVSFKAPGPTIFIGPVDVINGHFTSQFFIPKDISYGSQGAKVYIYAENGSYDAAGVVDSILVSGSIPSIQDSIGPAISLAVDDRVFGAGITMTPTTFILSGEIEDEHGVNITGQLGHAIVVKIDDGEVYDADVTDSFRYNRGEHTVGIFEISLESLPLGEHEISVKAWDNFNNSTLITKKIEVVESTNLELSQVMNYPNPIRNSGDITTFQYCLSGNFVDRVKISIFTEAGRKIKSFDLTSPQFTSMDCNYVDWDLKDADGDELSNGIYLYKIAVEGLNPEGRKMTANEAKKLVILR